MAEEPPAKDAAELAEQVVQGPLGQVRLRGEVDRRWPSGGYRSTAIRAGTRRPHPRGPVPCLSHDEPRLAWNAAQPKISVSVARALKGFAGLARQE